MNKLVISIVTWNSAATIYSCVQSVLDQTYTDFTLIIVDNDSKDETSSIVKSFNDIRIKFIQMNENTGFCGGHNYAIVNSQSEYVLLVNPDVQMSKDYIEKTLSVFNEGESIGTVCGLLLQGDQNDASTLIDSAGLEQSRSRGMEMRFHQCKLSEVNLDQKEVFGADGALPLYRRQMINDISYKGQFFDELFFAHKEDWDVSWRSHTYGWKAVFSPDCVAIHPRHFKPGNLKLRINVSDHIKFHSVKNQLLLLLKNESIGSFVRNSIFIIPRQFGIFLYILLFERTSLKAYSFIYTNFQSIMEKRKVIQSKRTKL
jgi:GT2 family glycosyltransferase